MKKTREQSSFYYFILQVCYESEEPSLPKARSLYKVLIFFFLAFFNFTIKIPDVTMFILCNCLLVSELLKLLEL